MEYIKTKTIENDEDFLRQVSATVLKEDNDLSRDISLLEKYCQENDVLALAAVQIGIPKRLIYLKNTNLDVVNRHLKKKIQ